MPNKIIPISQAAAEISASWNAAMAPRLKEMREAGATDAEMREFQEQALFYVFGGLMVSPR